MAAKEVLSKVIKGGLMIPFLLLEVETIIQHEDIFLSYFKNFLQYQGFSFILGKTVCTIIFPRKTKVNLDILTIKKCFLPNKSL